MSSLVKQDLDTIHEALQDLRERLGEYDTLSAGLDNKRLTCDDVKRELDALKVTATAADDIDDQDITRIQHLQIQSEILDGQLARLKGQVAESKVLVIDSWSKTAEPAVAHLKTMIERWLQEDVRQLLKANFELNSCFNATVAAPLYKPLRKLNQIGMLINGCVSSKYPEHQIAQIRALPDKIEELLGSIVTSGTY